MRRLFSIMLIIACCCTAVLSQASGAFAKTAPPPDDGQLTRVSDSINGTSMPIPYEFYETQIVGHWDNQICIAPSMNVNDMRCTTLNVKDVVVNGDEIYVVLAYQMALHDQANIYSNRGLHHNMWFGQPCGGGWIKGFVYHTGWPGAQTENIDHLPPPFPGLDVC